MAFSLLVLSHLQRGLPHPTCPSPPRNPLVKSRKWKPETIKPSDQIPAQYPSKINQGPMEIGRRRLGGIRPAARKGIDILGSLRMLVTKQATPIILFLAVYYAVSHMSITAMSSILKDRYGLGEIQIGLTFIANGVGSMIGSLVTARMKQIYEASLDAEAANDGTRSEDDFDDFPIARARL
ncbi:hypothetical protein ETB97_005929 [Aspergillus alliaceus]|uniref:Uncharacterized protein n=1 Tax=Petromyces alliaceus TaxID=209559 RepID=A0A8H5ZYF5_PETAA|nr:hypothetical protein ETB97_005929 [Aspergillus burnettii]